MKCHYTYHDGDKILIPYCWPVVHTNDMKNCQCRTGNKTFAQFQKEDYNKILQEKEKNIIDLEKENARLNRIIKKLTKKT